MLLKFFRIKIILTFAIKLKSKFLMRDNNYCVIMSGGIGSRFWPRYEQIVRLNLLPIKC